MTEATHTQGPWARALTECGKFYVAGVSEGEHVQVAVVTDSLNALENTALIAAAPELLELSEELLSAYTHVSIMMALECNSGFNPYTDDPLVIKARDIISSAKGEA